MKILARTRQLFKFIGFVPFDLPIGSLINAIHNVFTFALVLLAQVTTIWFGINTRDIFALSEAFYIGTMMLSMIGTFTALTCKKAEIIRFIEDLEQTIMDRTKVLTKIDRLYANTNFNVEKLTRLAILMLATSSAMFILSRAFLLAFTFLINDGTSDYISLIFPLV